MIQNILILKVVTVNPAEGPIWAPNARRVGHSPSGYRRTSLWRVAVFGLNLHRAPVRRVCLDLAQSKAGGPDVRREGTHCSVKQRYPLLGPPTAAESVTGERSPRRSRVDDPA